MDRIDIADALTARFLLLIICPQPNIDIDNALIICFLLLMICPRPKFGISLQGGLCLIKA